MDGVDGEATDMTRGADSRLINVENREIHEQEQLAEARTDGTA